MTAPTVHTFDSTTDAYDATQCREDVRDGDVLVIASEKVVGIAWTWPFALTENTGELHITTANPRTYQDGIFRAGTEVAERIAREHDWRTVPPLDVTWPVLFADGRCGEPIGYRPLTHKTQTGRVRTGWLLAGTTGFIELDNDGHYVLTGRWTSFNNEEKG